MNFFDGLVLQVKIRRSRELSSSGGQIKIRSPPCRVGRAERYLIKIVQTAVAYHGIWVCFEVYFIMTAFRDKSTMPG